LTIDIQDIYGLDGQGNKISSKPTYRGRLESIVLIDIKSLFDNYDS